VPPGEYASLAAAVISRSHDSDAFLVSILLPVTTFSILCYEIALTRLFAYIFTYDLTAMAVSFAVFGLGLGAYVRVRWLSLLPQRTLAVGAHLASSASLLVLYVVLILTHDNGRGHCRERDAVRHRRRCRIALLPSAAF